jgi:hypothetical protein
MSEAIHENLIVNSEAIDAVNEGEEIPEILDVDGDPIRLTYVSTDAWRGYYDAVADDDSRWIKLGEEESGWVTGNYDDAPVDARSDTVEAKCNRIAANLDAEGYDCAVVFAPTSNVFSTAYDLFKRRRVA